MCLLDQNPPLPCSPQMEIRDAYAKEIPSLAMMGRDLIRDLDPQNDLKFLRFRSKTHEIMISPCEPNLAMPRHAHTPTPQACPVESPLLSPGALSVTPHRAPPC